MIFFTRGRSDTGELNPLKDQANKDKCKTR